MPTLLQASISSVPDGAVTFLPSTVMFTSAIVIVVRPSSLAVGKASSSVVSITARRQISKLRPDPPRQPFQTDTACLLSDLRIPCGISSLWKLSALRPRRPADKTFVPTCFPRDSGYCRYPSQPRHESEIGSAFSLTSPCLRGKECTSRNFRVDKTS